ncbi:LysM peptidoglycan-binding domain-containing protein [Paenibacillus sp. MBLB4367]|uniref:LysM peptidoglycan-binding domain-containing protein n=1 Tax=Paenibacillus sp. MBLB4367 TaxID=3384767 RepID=UPI0039080153
MKRKLLSSAIVAVASMSVFATTTLGASYTVQPGDSLYKIAAKQGTTTTKLKSDNGLTSDMIMPGQVLNVSGPGTYTVRNGETMWIISQKLGVSLEALIAANKQIWNPNYIEAGYILNIPSRGSAGQSQTQAPAKPQTFADGFFPLPKGTYETLSNNYADERYWTGNGYEERKHEGVDIFAPKGTPIYSAAAGEVINYGWNQMGGWRLTVRVDGSTVFYYAHMSAYAPGMGKGAKIAKGQLIGYVGSTGYGPEGTDDQFVPHLHFGIYKTNSSPWTTIDPFNHLRYWEYNR